MEINNFHYHINVNSVLTYARNASFDFPELFEKFDELCSKLKPLLNMWLKPNLSYAEHQEKMSLPDSYRQLFDKPVLNGLPSNKQEALERAISQFQCLLGNPERCIKYLKIINKELTRYFEETHGSSFEMLDHNTIEFKKIDRHYYPIPKENYIGIKKYSALQEFLVLLFQKHGLPARVFKWIGFAPYAVADRVISEGNFGIECKFGLGLFHGKITHMLQAAIFLYAAYYEIEIDLKYEENGALKAFSMQDIFNALVSIQLPNSPNKLWHAIMDGGSDSNKISFREPQMLVSTIMRNGKDFGIDTLSNYLIDTFCKGLPKLLTACNAQLDSPLNLYEFLGKMDDLNFAVFSVPQFLVQHSLHKERQRKSDEKNHLLNTDDSYGLVEKTYHANRNFKPI